MPSATSPRNPLTRARFFLAQAEALPGTEQEAFDHFLQAAIVFGRSVYNYLHELAKARGVDATYRQWFEAKRTAMNADPVLGYFWKTRNLLVHRRHVPVQRRAFGTVSLSGSGSIYVEGRVTRSEPWYRRSLRILGHDAKATVMRPVHRLRHHLAEAAKRRRRVLRQRVNAWQTRWRNRKVVPTVRQFYLDDPEGLNRPAVDLVRTYLDRLEAIVAEAETRFPSVVG